MPRNPYLPPQALKEAILSTRDVSLQMIGWAGEAGIQAALRNGEKAYAAATPALKVAKKSGELATRLATTPLRAAQELFAPSSERMRQNLHSEYAEQVARFEELKNGNDDPAIKDEYDKILSRHSLMYAKRCISIGEAMPPEAWQQVLSRISFSGTKEEMTDITKSLAVNGPIDMIVEAEEELRDHMIARGQLFDLPIPQQLREPSFT